MKKLLTSIVVCLFLTLAFQTVANGQTGKNKKNIDIVFVGNSITYGAQLAKPEVEAPPVIASALLRKKNGIGQVRFLNQGRCGATTVDYLPEVRYLPEVITATNKFHVDDNSLLIFSVSLGTNDSAEEGPSGSPVSPDDYFKNFRIIIAQLLKTYPGCKVIIQQPIWYSPNTYNGARYLAGGLARLQTYFPEIKSLVDAFAKSDPGRVFMGDKKGFNYFRKNYKSDLDPEQGQQGTFYLHPNKKGAVVLGTYWGEAIYKVINAK